MCSFNSVAQVEDAFVLVASCFPLTSNFKAKLSQLAAASYLP